MTETETDTFEVTITIGHPTSGVAIEVATEVGITGREVIEHLVHANFISRGGYGLALKGGPMVRMDQTLQDAGVKSGDFVRVLLATDAG